jgi:hypothetical protein
VCAHIAGGRRHRLSQKPMRARTNGSAAGAVLGGTGESGTGAKSASGGAAGSFFARSAKLCDASPRVQMRAPVRHNTCETGERGEGSGVMALGEWAVPMGRRFITPRAVAGACGGRAEGERGAAVGGGERGKPQPEAEGVDGCHAACAQRVPPPACHRRKAVKGSIERWRARAHACGSSELDVPVRALQGADPRGMQLNERGVNGMRMRPERSAPCRRRRPHARMCMRGV